MDDLERMEVELRHCLRHVDAPEGFTDRVMSRVAQRNKIREPRNGSRGVLSGMRRHASWWAATAAAFVITAAGGDGLHIYHQRQTREAAAAQAQVDLAMQLTNHALNEVTIGLHRSPAGRFAQLWNGTEK